MGDSRLQALRREARSSGDPHSQARLLLERVRSGSLTRERLELAAYCRYEPARVATGSPASPWPLRDEWVPGLDRWEGATLAAALSASIPCIRKLLRSYSGPSGQSRAAQRRLADAKARAKRMEVAAWSGLNLDRNRWIEDVLDIWEGAPIGLPDWYPCPDDLTSELAERIEGASYWVGDRPLRRAWSTHLARWALRES